MDYQEYQKLCRLNTYFSFGRDEYTGFISGSICLHEFVQAEARNCCWDNYRILFLLEGEGSYQDDIGNFYELGPGSLLQRLPNLNHHISRSQKVPWVEFALVISRSLYQNMVAMGILEPGNIHCFRAPTPHVIDQIKEFMTLLRKLKTQEQSKLAVAEAMRLLAILFQDKPQSSDDDLEQKIDQACRMLSENLNQAPYMPDIAEAVGMGYHSFRKYFKQYRGISPKEYLLRCRIDKAIELISYRSDSLSEIAFELGYPDFATFAKQFKKRTGYSPGSYRRH